MSKPPIPRTIWALGWVSLFTDMSSELVHSLLPLLLAGPLGVGALAIGLLEGAAEALVLFTKVFSGYLSDAIGRRKPLVLLGYGLAAAVKPLFPLADSLVTVASARLLDRFGKGIRGAPRDALIGDLAPASIRAACFGLRQSMDTVGAILGPVLAIGLMQLFADDIHTALWFAVLPGVVAVALLLRLREPDVRPHPPARLPLSREGLRRLGVAFWAVALLGGLIGLARFSEAFLLLRAVERGLPVAWAPATILIMAAVYAAVAYPAGRLADRIDAYRLLGIGMLALAVAHAVLAFGAGAVAVLTGSALWGLHMGLSQGLLASLVAETAPAEYRGTAFGAFNLVSGLALLVASGAAGWAWDRYGASMPFVLGMLCALLAAAWVYAAAWRRKG